MSRQVFERAVQKIVNQLFPNKKKKKTRRAEKRALARLEKVRKKVERKVKDKGAGPATGKKKVVADGAVAIGAENVGFNMLRKMGWEQGEGLGIGKEGRKDPIDVEKRKKRAGLGA